MTDSFSTQGLAGALRAQLPRSFEGKICVAFSGGGDSTVLLHALRSLNADYPEWRIRAIHVDHQLHFSSSEWAAHCERVAKSLKIELSVARVSVPRNGAHGLEAAARNARYTALREQLQEGEVLVTAHHADDQAETVLLALLRGSGVPGLAAMPAAKPFGRGFHVRPLLSFTRAELQAWARARGLVSIDDPANAVLRHDRNYLRHEIIPPLEKRWPATANNLGRSAAHLGEALGLLEELANTDLKAAAVGACLNIEALRSLSEPRCRNLLRFWFRSQGLRPPSTRKLFGLMQDLFNTDLDRVPCVKWQGIELHWHRNLLYSNASPTSLDNTSAFEGEWSWRSAYALPATLGQLSMLPTTDRGFSAEKLPDRLTVRFRRGGEKIQLPGRQHRSALRNLLQESDVLPWWRDKLPLVFADKRLLSVGDLYLADDFAAAPGEIAMRVHWEGAPMWKAVRGT